MRDEKVNVLKNLDGDLITTKVFVTTNTNLKEQLMAEHRQKSDLGEKNKDAYQDGVQATLTFMRGQIEKSICKIIDNSSHHTSGKIFKQHADDNEIVKCIECMYQVCDTNGDETFIHPLSDYHDRVSEMDNLEQGDR